MVRTIINHTHGQWDDSLFSLFIQTTDEPKPMFIIKMEKLTKTESKLVENVKVAAEIVMIEDRELLEELGKS